MTAAAPTLGQIKAQVSAIHHKVPHARIIGIRSPGRWSGPAEEHDGEQSYAIHQCDSPLAMRVALRQPVDERTTKVLITPLEEGELSDDILLRLAKRRLFQIDAWQIVRSLFQARAVDPRLTRHSWMADALLDAMSPEGYPAARGGFLDAETVWPLLLRKQVGLQAESPDLTSILKWSLDPVATALFRQSPSNFQSAAIEWLSERAGPVADLVLQCLGRLDRPDAVPLGLAVGVVFHPQAVGKLEKATGKLEERFLEGKTPEPKLMLRWSAAATEVVRALRHTESRAYRQTLQRADEILAEIQAESFARLSDTSLLGFDQRLGHFGQSLAETVERKSWDLLSGLQSAHQVVRAHDQAIQETRRLERIDMSMRLIRWLGESQAGGVRAKSLVEAAEQHLHDGGFVDWARLRFRAGDPVRELSEAYAQLFDAVRAIRERQSQHFAQLLVDWTIAGSQGSDVVPVERVLEQVVAPVAADSPVLVIVIDGMSVAVCRELLADLTRHEWIALSEPGRTSNRPGLATIPSVTEFSRTSLLSGRLCQGSQTEERAGFAEHPAMLARCRAGFPPVLFHKIMLQEAADAVLAAEVRKEIASAHRRIVGVVVNAVDDHLLKGEQIDTRWSRDEIKVLPALLHEARIARRKVILISDHGHVLDCQAQSRPSDAGERWRAATGAPATDELLVEGHRVLVEGHRLIAPWSERIRYGIKKNGYHGGLTPQEMVVPIVVLSSTEDVPAGWQEQPVDIPAWWDEPTGATRAEVPPVPQLKPTAPKDARLLFDLDAEEQSTATAIAADITPQWVQRLLKSSVFDEQKQLAGRGLPTDEVLAKFLSTLDRRGGKLTSVALARVLAFPEMRLPGLLAKVQRILNVDGYAVLNRDDASDTIELNRELLLKQFDLV